MTSIQMMKNRFNITNEEVIEIMEDMEIMYGKNGLIGLYNAIDVHHDGFNGFYLSSNLETDIILSILYPEIKNWMAPKYLKIK